MLSLIAIRQVLQKETDGALNSENGSALW